MSSIKIAVIDNGVDEKKYNIKQLYFDYEIDEGLNISKNSIYEKQISRHGTICAGIIRKYAPDASISSIKVANVSDGRAKKECLIKAFNTCVQYGIRIANVSLGTTTPGDFDEVIKCINRVTKEGLIIVAAYSNKSQYTLPACSTNVIGVKCHRFYADGMYRFYKYPFDGVDISASSKHQLDGIQGYIETSNSYAAPLITAKVYNILLQNSRLCFEEIKYELYKQAVNYDRSEYNPYIRMSADWISGGEANPNTKWDGELYEKHLKLYYKTGEIDIPVIAVKGGEMIHIKLRMLFLTEGYYPITVSQDNEDALSGCEYMPRGIDEENFIYNVLKKYGCDVIIVRYIYKNSKNVSDITVDFKNKNECEIINNESKQSIYIENQNEYLLINELYKTVKCIFE